MINPECLDPKEVLEHLFSLGYYNISPQQLKEFLHDLKKLIKYEQKLASRECIKVTAIDRSDDTANQEEPECECTSSDFSDNLDKTLEGSDYESSTYSRSTTGTYNAGNDHQSARNQVETECAQRYHTSFIRAWNLQGCKDLPSRSKRNIDPVRLYHQYKEVWQKLRIPGENKHLDLRWNIRNRMVGQEPSPRVCI